MLQSLIPHSHSTESEGSQTQNPSFTEAKDDKLTNIEDGAEVNVRSDFNATSGDAEILNKPTDLTDLSTHSVTECSDVTHAGSGSVITATERAKLAAIDAEATKNDADSDLKNRVNHTGKQAISTVTGLQTALDSKVDSSRVQTDVPSGAVFTDTTYTVSNGGLTEKNFTSVMDAKLASIESNAKDDQTGAEIKTLYEGNNDTNAFTNSEKTKLSGIATQANKYELPVASGSLGGVVSGSGGDITVDQQTGIVTVIDDSHNHETSNIDGLDNALSGKLATSGGTITGDLEVEGVFKTPTPSTGLIPVMTSNSQNGYEASASNVYPSSSNLYVAYKAFDQNIDDTSTTDATYWTTENQNNGVERWLKIELPTAKQAWKAVLKFKYLPKDFQIQGSNDDSEWDTLWAGSTPFASVKELPLLCRKKYLYYRFWSDNKDYLYVGLFSFQLY